tara:strand:+ start:54195 stop:54569 length:375 start_codon:yes stop_codon:yes gene_type:complete
MNQRNKNIDFGLVLSLALLLFALWMPHRPYFLKIAIFSLLITILVPFVLTPFSWLWLKLGRLLEKVGSIVLLSVLFFFVLTPIAFLMRLFGQDSLRLRPKDKGANSFFIQRVKRFEGSDFKKQF